MNQNRHQPSSIQPKIKRIWVDVSALLILPKGMVGGIPRTIYKLLDLWHRHSFNGITIRTCVFHERHGIIEVDPNYAKSCAEVIPEEPEEKVIPIQKTAPPHRPRSKAWKLLPWWVQWLWFGEAPEQQRRFGPHRVSRRLIDFWQGSDELPDIQKARRQEYHPYIPESLLRPVVLSNEDLVISLGALWLIPGFSELPHRDRDSMGYRFISMVYDLLPMTNPQFFGPGVINIIQPPTVAQMEDSDLLLTISQYVRSEMLEYSNKNRIALAPVEPVVLGADITRITQPSSINIERPFILTVGSIEERKNHYGMYLAWKKLAKILGPEKVPLLVMAGKPAWRGEQIIHLIQNDPESKNNIQVRTRVSDADLDWLYQNCLFTIYPSLNEGWGLPVEESFAYGKLCVTTTAASLPEVGGTFADYVEPEDIDSLVKGVIKALDPTYRAERETHIRNNYRPNTWLACAQQIENIVQRYFELIK